MADLGAIGVSSMPAISESVPTAISQGGASALVVMAGTAKSCYGAPYKASVTAGAADSPAMVGIDIQGTISGTVKISGAPVPFAKVCLYYRTTGALVNIAFCDQNGAYMFSNLDRNATSDDSYFVVAIDPNGLGTQYDSAIHDRVIPG